jgi:hypothetical protein
LLTNNSIQIKVKRSCYFFRISHFFSRFFSFLLLFSLSSLEFAWSSSHMCLRERPSERDCYVETRQRRARKRKRRRQERGRETERESRSPSLIIIIVVRLLVLRRQVYSILFFLTANIRLIVNARTIFSSNIFLKELI